MRKAKKDTNEYPFISQEGHKVTSRIIIETPNARSPRVFKYISECVYCGSEMALTNDQLKGSKAKKSCGCKLSEHLRTNYKGGVHDMPEYAIYYAIRNRTSNPNNKSYKNYGGRGIKLSPLWDTFEKFISDMGRRPSSKHSIERIDNDGDYAPDNCIWATTDVQVKNKRKQKQKYNGSIKLQKSGRYQAMIDINKKHYYLGTFEDEEDAQTAIDALVRDTI
jgi:hypothetical protein